MIDLANSTKNLSVNSVALSEVTFKKWRGEGNYINIQRKKIAMKVRNKHNCEQITIQRKS